MCYHTLYQFLTCGHCVASTTPLAHQRPTCPARSKALFHHPSLSSPINSDNGKDGLGINFPEPEPSPWADEDTCQEEEGEEEEEGAVVAPVVCNERLSHPLHTYRIDSLCRRCRWARERRLARFEVGSIRDGVERGVQRPRVAATKEGKMPSPALRSGYVEGRGRGKGRGMILDRNGTVQRGNEDGDGNGEVLLEER